MKGEDLGTVVKLLPKPFCLQLMATLCDQTPPTTVAEHGKPGRNPPDPGCSTAPLRFRRVPAPQITRRVPGLWPETLVDGFKE